MIKYLNIEVSANKSKIFKKKVHSCFFFFFKEFVVSNTTVPTNYTILSKYSFSKRNEDITYIEIEANQVIFTKILLRNHFC